MNTSDFCIYGGCWSTYIHKWPNIGNALRGFFTGTQSEKDGSNKAHMLSHMSLGVISTKHPGLIEEKKKKKRNKPVETAASCFRNNPPTHTQKHDNLKGNTFLLRTVSFIFF